MDSHLSRIFRGPPQKLVVIKHHGEVHEQSSLIYEGKYSRGFMIQEQGEHEETDRHGRIHLYEGSTGRVFLHLERLDGIQHVWLFEKIDDIGKKRGVRQENIPAPIVIKKAYYQKDGLIYASSSGLFQRLVIDGKFVTPPEHFVTNYHESNKRIFYVANRQLFAIIEGKIYPIRAPAIKKFAFAAGSLSAFYPDGNFVSRYDPDWETEILKGIDQFVVPHFGISAKENYYSIDQSGEGKVIFPGVLDFLPDITHGGIMYERQDTIIFRNGSIMKGETMLEERFPGPLKGVHFIDQKYNYGEMIVLTNPSRPFIRGKIRNVYFTSFTNSITSTRIGENHSRSSKDYSSFQRE